MMRYHVNCSRSKKGQMKIQEMAFVLVALMVFFAMISLVYLTVRMSSLQQSAIDIRAEEAKGLVQKISGTPEFAWTAFDCSNCIDFDKALMIKERNSYQGFWSLDYLRIERVYPTKSGLECNRANYPDCDSLTIINKSVGTPAVSFVSLCRVEFGKSPYTICELGKIYASGKAIPQ